MDNQNLMDLCRLNLMEDNISDLPEDQEKSDTLFLIKRKKRELTRKIVNRQPAASQAVMARHIENNTSANGIYPWTDEMEVMDGN